MTHPSGGGGGVIAPPTKRTYVRTTEGQSMHDETHQLISITDLQYQQGGTEGLKPENLITYRPQNVSDQILNVQALSVCFSTLTE